MNLTKLRSELKSNITDIEISDGPNHLLVNDDNFRWVPDSSVDSVITDPPFNIARDTNFHTYEKNTINSFRFDEGKGWDSYSVKEFIELMGNWASEFERVLKPGGTFAIFCADEYLSDLIRQLKKAGLKPRRTITWRKPNAVPVNRKFMMMSSCEYIVTGVKGTKATFNADIQAEEFAEYTPQEIVAIADKAAVIVEQAVRKSVSGVNRRLSKPDLEQLVLDSIASAAKASAKRSVNIYRQSDALAELCIPNFVNFNSKSGNRLHPTEKPVELLRYLIELISKLDDTLLDPFSGSGSLGEAAMLSGRGSILVEMDKEFFDRSNARLQAQQAASL